MPLEDRVIVLQRLAALENKLLEQSGQYVSIIKNYGRLVGGSLSHGHQQIGVSNILPNRIRQDQQFAEVAWGDFPVLYAARKSKGIIDQGLRNGRADHALFHAQAISICSFC